MTRYLLSIFLAMAFCVASACDFNVNINSSPVHCQVEGSINISVSGGDYVHIQAIPTNGTDNTEYCEGCSTLQIDVEAPGFWNIYVWDSNCQEDHSEFVQWIGWNGFTSDVPGTCDGSVEPHIAFTGFSEAVTSITDCDGNSLGFSSAWQGGTQIITGVSDHDCVIAYNTYGCQATVSNIVEYESLGYEVDVAAPSCPGIDDGSVAVSLDEGILDSYALCGVGDIVDSGDAYVNIGNIGGGMVCLEITQGPCMSTIEEFIEEPQEQEVSWELTSPVDVNNENAAVDITVLPGPAIVTHESTSEEYSAEPTAIINALNAGIHSFTITDPNGCVSSLQIEIPVFIVLLGDIDLDGVVGISDLLLFLPQFGCSQSCDEGDYNTDGVVNALDLLLFLAQIG